MDYSFEEMSTSHRQAVIDIFNYFIKHSYAAFPEKELGSDFFDRFLEMSPGYPKVVVKAPDQGVIGFGAMRPHHFADSFQRTAEISYFLLPA
ncbi:MAG: N-acetyltransferase, partial [Syntrophales bacterium]|nr:N-acetyltransferase [Syntrophales bacterium]